MNGRYSVNDILGRCYWKTDDMRDAFDTAMSYTAPRDWNPEGIVAIVIVRDDVTENVVYVQRGHVA